MGHSYDRGYESGWARLMAMPIPDKPMQIDEIAEIVGCSKQNISQLERNALRKLRRTELKDWEDEA